MNIEKIKVFFNQHKNNILVGLGVLVVIALVVGLVMRQKRNQLPMQTLAEGCKAGDLFSETTGKRCTDEPLEACKEGDVYNVNTGELCAGMDKKDTGSSKGSLSYDGAIKKYAGKSLMFDEACASNPQNLEVAVGTTMLFANNSTKPIELTIGDKKTKVSSYHYLLNSVSIVGNVAVACNGTQSATVVVK